MSFPYFVQRFVEGQPVDCLSHLLRQSVRQLQQHAIRLMQRALRRHGRPGIFADEGERALREIADAIRQIGINPRNQRPAREIPVIAERHFAQQKIPHRVEPEFLHQRPRIDKIARGFAHLFAFHGPPAMAEHPPW